MITTFPPAFEVVELAIAQLCAGDSQLAKQEVRLLPKGLTLCWK